MTELTFRPDLDRLTQISDPVERARAAAKLIEQADAFREEIRNIRDDAGRAMLRRDASDADVAVAMGVHRQQIQQIFGKKSERRLTAS